MLEKILKKKEPMTFKDIQDFERATIEQVKEATNNCESWAEVTNRLNSLTLFKNKLTAKAGQVPEDVMARRRNLEAKCQILRTRRNQIEAEQAEAKADADKRFAETTWKQERSNFRYSVDGAVSRMHRLGIDQVPISMVQWKKCENESGIVEVVTASNRRVKIDFTRLTARHWQLLKEQRFSPLLIGVENSHILRDGKKEGIMLDSNFHPREKIVIQQTWLAVMLT
jgi:hypothetical protein